nr:hypothetical protein [Thermoanaerobaculia bacterium]
MALRFGRSLGSCLLLALLTGLPAGAECTAFSAGDRKEIHRLAERYAEAWRANDRAAVMGVFAPEAVILPDQQPTVSGLAAIEAYYFPAGGSSTTVVSFENSSKELS